MPTVTCESWCYESAAEFIEARALSNGRIELRHRVDAHPHLILVTTVTPAPASVEFLARIDINGSGDIPDDLMTPNLCWQLRRAPEFASQPDPYPEFVKRCFIFTDDGMTFLHHTTRYPIPVRPVDDPCNNPVWVQMYLPVWEPLRRADAGSWADYSPDRYAYPVIGAVSRDGQYLTAIANDRPLTLSQAWHDCMHNNPVWQTTEDGPVWRLKIYAMENDPDGLLRYVGRDFPHALALKDGRVTG